MGQDPEALILKMGTDLIFKNFSFFPPPSARLDAQAEGQAAGFV